VDWCFQIALVLFSIFFLMNEVTQLFDDGLGYFTSVWNYVDFTPPILTITIVIFHILDGVMTINPIGIAVIFSVAVFFMWLKLLYFLRIFEHTGYLIRMIIEVVADMRFFLLILFVA